MDTPLATPPPLAIRLMLVDDHPLVRDGLRARLNAVPDLAVVAEAADAEQALIEARRALPDVVLMDIGLRGTNGIVATRQLRAAQPSVRVVMLTMFDSPQTRREAFAAGASAYLLKDCPAAEIVQAIHDLMSGAEPDEQDRGCAAEPGPGAAIGVREHAALTPREREVLALIAEGLSSRDIGERLNMGARTVETHRTHLRRKLNLGSPAALVRYATLQHPRG